MRCRWSLAAVTLLQQRRRHRGVRPRKPPDMALDQGIREIFPRYCLKWTSVMDGDGPFPVWAADLHQRGSHGHIRFWRRCGFVEVPRSTNLCFHDYRWLGNSDCSSNCPWFFWGIRIPLAPNSLHSPLDNYSGWLTNPAPKGWLKPYESWDVDLWTGQQPSSVHIVPVARSLMMPAFVLANSTEPRQKKKTYVLMGKLRINQRIQMISWLRFQMLRQFDVHFRRFVQEFSWPKDVTKRGFLQKTIQLRPWQMGALHFESAAPMKEQWSQSTGAIQFSRYIFEKLTLPCFPGGV